MKACAAKSSPWPAPKQQLTEACRYHSTTGNHGLLTFSLEVSKLNRCVQHFRSQIAALCGFLFGMLNADSVSHGQADGLQLLGSRGAVQ
jgi:hypothetical protein